MIDLTKKYTTVGEHEVQLHSIKHNIVYGKYRIAYDYLWNHCTWDVHTGYLFDTGYGNLTLIEIEENMISLDKKYKTAAGWDVVLFEISDKVYGKVNYCDKEWVVCVWPFNGFYSTNSVYNLVEVPEFKVISEVVRQYKTVKYFNFDIIVPVWVNYIATESNGNVIGFNRSPVLGCKELSWNNDKLYDQTATKLLSITFDGDWRKSLMRIK